MPTVRQEIEKYRKENKWCGQSSSKCINCMKIFSGTYHNYSNHVTTTYLKRKENLKILLEQFIINDVASIILSFIIIQDYNPREIYGLYGCCEDCYLESMNEMYNCQSNGHYK